MSTEFINTLLGKQTAHPFVAVDIGTSAIKVMEVDVSSGKPQLVAAAIGVTPPGSLQNNAIIRPQQVGSALRSLLDQNDITATKATIAIPGPSVFSKKITIGYVGLKELDQQIGFEASNYIPHKIDAVHLDYQVLRANGKSTMDVLLVAVKNEIVNGYTEALRQAGLEPAIADVDYFALENMFESSYPEEQSKTIGLINIGSRYTAVNILQNGETLFSGDVGVGGRLYTDALCETLGMQPQDAERAKSGAKIDGCDNQLLHDTLDRTTEHVASELQRQIGFYWNAAATDRAIDAIYVCGGASQVPGLVEELGAKTGIPCTIADPFRGIECGENFDKDFLREIGPAMGVSVGLAARRFGDKQHAIS